MQWFLRICAAALVGLAAPVANAGCIGANILDDLQRTDPAAHDSIFELAREIPNGEGRFWRVERAGSTPSYMFGTFHTAEAVATVTPAVWEQLDQARVAIFELTLSEQAAMEARMASDPTFAFDLETPPLSQRLTAAQLRVIDEALSTRGLSVEAADYMRPWLLFTLLGFPACHIQAMAAGEEPLDKVMARRAGDRGTPTVGLETYEQALSAFQRIRPERFLSQVVETSAMVAGEEDIFRTNTELYQDGHVAAIAELSIWLSEQQGIVPDSRALNDEIMTEVLDVRNRAWMPELVGQMRKGNAFIAVGALHLPGENGLVELLRARGFEVTRIAP